MTEKKDRPGTIEEVVEKLWQGVLDTIESLVNPPPQPVPVPIRKGPRRR